MSSKPPEFTIPPTPLRRRRRRKPKRRKTTRAPRKRRTDAGSDKAANEEEQSFGGHGAVQDAFDRMATGNLQEHEVQVVRLRPHGRHLRLQADPDTDMFVTSAIPIPQGEGQNIVLTPRYTRLGFDTETKSTAPTGRSRRASRWTSSTGTRPGLFGSFPLRLRFAWIEFDHFRVGQDASVFMDYDVFPNVLDYEGPPGMVLMRQPVSASHSTQRPLEIRGRRRAALF